MISLTATSYALGGRCPFLNRNGGGVDKMSGGVGRTDWEERKKGKLWSKCKTHFKKYFSLFFFITRVCGSVGWYVRGRGQGY